MTLTVELWGTVEDLDTQKIKGSWAEENADDVTDFLKSKGFDEFDFNNYLVSTESGEYANIYAINGSIPYNWKRVYVFKIDGKQI